MESSEERVNVVSGYTWLYGLAFLQRGTPELFLRSHRDSFKVFEALVLVEAIRGSTSSNRESNQSDVWVGESPNEVRIRSDFVDSNQRRESSVGIAFRGHHSAPT